MVRLLRSWQMGLWSPGAMLIMAATAQGSEEKSETSPRPSSGALPCFNFVWACGSPWDDWRPGAVLRRAFFPGGKARTGSASLPADGESAHGTPKSGQKRFGDVRAVAYCT